MQERALLRETPYGKPGASDKIVELLRKVDIDEILFKKFYEIRNA